MGRGDAVSVERRLLARLLGGPEWAAEIGYVEDDAHSGQYEKARP